MSDVSQQLGRLLACQPAEGLTLQRGTVVTWDTTDGFTIYVAGTVLQGVLVLAGVTALSPGDQVAVLRQKGNALILGKITHPS